MISNSLEIFVNGKSIGVCTGASLTIPDTKDDVQVTEKIPQPMQFMSLLSLNDIEKEYTFKGFAKHINKFPQNKRSWKFRVFGAWAVALNRWRKITVHPDKVFIEAKNGTYILPKDGSYIRYISNSWYE